MNGTHNTRSDRPISVLLAEDDQDLRFILSHSLIQGGYLVNEVHSIAEMEDRIIAIQENDVARRGTDIIVSDVNLSDGSVVPLLMKYRTFISSFPTLLITSDKSPELLRIARKIGIHDVLGKPFDLPFFLAVICHALMMDSVRV